MANFTTRVELHSATSTDYDALHLAMQAAGFSRTIVSNDQKVYILPTAEYVCSGQFDRAVVLKVAGEAAAKTGKNYSVLVTEATAWTYIGLRQK